MSDDGKMLSALDLNAQVKSSNVRIHMDGDRDGEMLVTGPFDGGEVHDGEIYRLRVSGQENGASTTVAWFVPAELIDIEGFDHE